MGKRKLTTKQRLGLTAQRADELDARRREQIANQIQSINGLVLLVRAMEVFIEEEGLTEAWTAYRAHVSSEPCYICKAPNNHWGIPHSEAMGDNKTRADADRERKAAEQATADPAGA